MLKRIKRNPRKLKIFKGMVAGMIFLFAIADAAIIKMYCYPTFSWVVRDNRTDLIWLTFLFGGLISKIYYNRTVSNAQSETKGFFTFATMVILLFVVGKQCIIPMGNMEEFAVLIAGGFFAYGVWPQYADPGDSD